MLHTYIHTYIHTLYFNLNYRSSSIELISLRKKKYVNQLNVTVHLFSNGSRMTSKCGKNILCQSGTQAVK